MVVQDRRTVLIVGINYQPEVTGIAPYTTGLAEYLSGAGHDVTVLTSFPHYPAWKVLPEHANLPSVDCIEGVRLRRFKHYIPRNPGSIGRVLMEVSFAVKVSTAKWDNPDVVICVSPSLISSALTLLRIKLRKRRPRSVAWVQDFYSKGVVEAVNGGGILAKLATIFEARVLSLADEVVVIHDRFKRTACDVLDIPSRSVSVVRNWTHIASFDDVDANRAEFGWGTDEVIVLHAGNMGAKQALENVVDAARIADERGDNVRFVLLGDGNQRAKLEELARGVERVEFLDPVDDNRFRSALLCADVLLLNEKPGVSDMAVPSKLTTYFAAGKPVLAATQYDSASAGEVQASGGGEVVPPGEPAVLLDQVLKLSAERSRMEQLGRAGLRYQRDNLSADSSLERFRQRVINSPAETVGGQV